MTSVRGLWHALKELPLKYPAVLSAYIIYGYLFMVMIRFFIIARSQTLSFYDIFEIFDAVPFLWMLAMMLVKVIEMRTMLHESEKSRLLGEQELEIRKTQVGTMREVVLGMQHHINNPLAIITLTLQKIKRTEPMSPGLAEGMERLEHETQRITQVLKDYGTTRDYDTEEIGRTDAVMAMPHRPPERNEHERNDA